MSLSRWSDQHFPFPQTAVDDNRAAGPLCLHGWHCAHSKPLERDRSDPRRWRSPLEICKIQALRKVNSETPLLQVLGEIHIHRIHVLVLVRDYRVSQSVSHLTGETMGLIVRCLSLGAAVGVSGWVGLVVWSLPLLEKGGGGVAVGRVAELSVGKILCGE
jgi:hypothetical protein